MAKLMAGRVATVLALLIVLFAAVQVTGCGCGTPTGPEEQGQATRTAPAKTEPGVTPGETREASGFIVFERDYRLVRVNEDGSGEKVLTTGFDTDPAVSRDGVKIAYAHRDRDPRTSTSLSRTPPAVEAIYIANADGTGPERVTPEEWGTSTGWEPLFKRQEGTVWVQRDCSQPSFSTDGKKLAFVMRDHAYQESPGGGKGGYGLSAVAVMALEGPSKGKPEVVASRLPEEYYSGGGFNNPRFSSDGAFIYFDEFGSGGPPGASICRVKADGTNKQVIAHFEMRSAEGGMNTGYYAFDISPVDGSIAAVELSHPGAGTDFKGRVQLMDAEGSNRRYVDTGDVYVGADNLCYSPDGGSLAFSTQEFGRATFGAPSDIYRVGIDGANLQKIVTSGRDAAWGVAGAR